jgi:hypothetical protein
MTCLKLHPSISPAEHDWLQTFATTPCMIHPSKVANLRHDALHDSSVEGCKPSPRNNLASGARHR